MNGGGRSHAKRLAAFLAFAYVLPQSANAVELKQETTEAFNQYVRATEDRMAEELRDSRNFLRVDGFPEPQRDKRYSQLRQGEIIVERLETLERDKRIRAPHGQARLISLPPYLLRFC